MFSGDHGEREDTEVWPGESYVAVHTSGIDPQGDLGMFQNYICFFILNNLKCIHFSYTGVTDGATTCRIDRFKTFYYSFTN